MTSRHLIPALLCLAFALPATAANAATATKAYSNLGMKNTFDPSNCESVLGPYEFQGTATGTKFVAQATGPLAYIDLALSDFEGQNGAIITVAPDDTSRGPSLPGKPLETFFND